MIVSAVVFLYFFQLIADFVEAIYAFGLLGTSIPPEIVMVLLFVTPAGLLFLPRGLPRRALALTGGVVLVAGAVEVLLGTRGRMLVSGIGVGAFMVFLPSLLSRQALKPQPAAAARWGAGLALGLMLAVMLRAWNSGADPSGQPLLRGIEWLLALVAVALVVRRSRRRTASSPDIAPAGRAGFLRTATLSLGLVAALTLLYFAFASPNVIARWTGEDYRMILGLLVLAFALLGVAAWIAARRPMALSARALLVWNLVFVASLASVLLAHQLDFPAGPEGYPFYEPAVAGWLRVPLAAMILLSPGIVLAFIFYARELADLRPAPRSLAGAFTLAALFLVVMIFAHVFTTVYDYIPLVGPFFRDKFSAVYLVVGSAMALPLILVRRPLPLSGPPAPRVFAAGLIVIGVAAIAGAPFTSARPVPAPMDNSSLRILTYNIQQGYNADGLKSYDAQLEVIRQVNADLIGLQESDTNRIAGGNSDLVRYFADRLDLYSYYGPKVVPGTFGIALLSKYPIDNPRTFYMYSDAEQTATIWAQVGMGGRRFNVFVTHLGNGGPIVQQEQFLQELTGQPNVIAMGDFNFKPGTPQYRLTTAVLADAWLLRWPAGVDDRGLDPADRIDHIFLSPGIEVTDARFLTGPESDHSALVVEIGW